MLPCNNNAWYYYFNGRLEPINQTTINKWSTTRIISWAYVPETVNILLLSRTLKCRCITTTTTVTWQNRMVKFHRLYQPMVENYKQKATKSHTKTTPWLEGPSLLKIENGVRVCVYVCLFVEREMHRICVVDIILTRCL